VVVAVHSMTEINDDVAINFTRHFYQDIIFGHTIEQAFEYAKKMIGASKNKLQSCCCAHEHKQDCVWIKYLKATNNSKAAHDIHMPKCTCSIDKNFHKINCDWVLGFPKKIRLKLESDNQNEEEFFLIDEKVDKEMQDQKAFLAKLGKQPFCCCSPEIDHGEQLKFQLIGDPEFKKKSLYEKDEVEEGKPIVEMKKARIEKASHHVGPMMLVGRDALVQEIAETLLKSRIIHVYGDPGVGKSQVIKRVAKYTSERGHFSTAIAYIEIQK